MKKTIQQFSKFAVVGILNTAIDFFIYYGLTSLFNFWNEYKILTASLSFIIANLNSFLFNKFWTFQNKETKHHILYSKFFIISLIGLGINDLLFSFCHYQLQLNDLLAKIMPIPVVMLWNFFANKYWTFKSRQN
jgi:putative flippase GtrA